MSYLRRPLIRHVAGALLALMLAPGVLAQTGRTVEVRASEFAFEPNQLRVEQDETITLKLVNAGSLSHNIHLAGADIRTETIQGGGSDTITFTAGTDGIVSFFCNVPGHKQAGMEGEIVIER
ncbi:plastocyanin/azurin family copper-binding protein [Spiribacter sp. 1M153]|uniref:cupredoxin domain-containing protein n=1 Tax=Spiribacter roseus TaxID=1855875 RepID=UPI00349FC48B